MKIHKRDLYRRLGLPSAAVEGLTGGDDAHLSSSETDPKTGLVVLASSKLEFDSRQRARGYALQYWRQLPYGVTNSQDLINIEFADAGKNEDEVEIKKIYFQGTPVYDSDKDDINESAVQLKVFRTIEAVNRVNTHLRNFGPVSDLAKIIVKQCQMETVKGESVKLRGLDPDGGFNFQLTAAFTQAAAKEGPLVLDKLDMDKLKTVMGFHINTLEPSKDYSTPGEPCVSLDPPSGVTYETGVEWSEKGKTCTMNMYVKTLHTPEGAEAMDIPSFLRFEFKNTSDDSYELVSASFMGETVPMDDRKTIQSLIGLAQAANKDFAQDAYPSFMDRTAEYDLLDQINPLPVPKSLEKEGGELRYVSMHGSGHEKSVEYYGDQIGAGGLFLQQGVTEGGQIDSVGVCIDFPFATGDTHSNYDGAVPDYLAFWDDIDSFFMTHDHFDHADGMAYYARAGLMTKKTVYATSQVKYALKQKMDMLKVPHEYLPKIIAIDEEGAVPIKDDNGNVRMWVQYCPNGTSHSALTTPYIVSGCYNDDHYNGSVAVYGDGNALTDKGKAFFETGTSALGQQEGVTKSKVKEQITAVLHDPTAIRYEGHAPKPEAVEDNLEKVFSWFDDKGVLFAPISTNHQEYVIGTNLAHRTGRDLTAVGRNAELRTSCLNLYGLNPDMNLRDIVIDPLEEWQKPDPLIPRHILREYFSMHTEIDALNPDSKRSDYDKAVQKKHADFKGGANDNDQEVDPDAELPEQPRKPKSKLPKVDPSQREHERYTEDYIRDHLTKYGEVRFENDVNGHLMYCAIRDRQATASFRATRTSQIAKNFRFDPSRLMVFITGTQGNEPEKMSTLRKFSQFFSLLDADPEVRPTGYKINSEDFVVVVTQPSIPGNENSQDMMIDELIRNRDITVVCAFKEGFKIYNPKDKRDKILHELSKTGWSHTTDTQGTIIVSGKAIHVHGHGFKEDLVEIATSINAKTHEVQHVPDRDSYHNDFLDIVRDYDLQHSGQEPNDFQVMRIDGKAKEPENMFKKIAALNPSYILVRLAREYGKFYNGWLEMRRMTTLRRDGEARQDGLMARSTSEGTYQKSATIQDEWERHTDNKRERRARKLDMGPSPVDRTHSKKPRSRPLFRRRISNG